MLPQTADKVRFVHAGYGVNDLPDLQKHAISIDCRDYVGLIRRSASGNFAFVIILSERYAPLRYIYGLLNNIP